MPQIQYTVNVSGLGQAINQTLNYTDDGGTPREVDVPPGYAGTLTTRTDDNTGTVTLAAGHGIVTGDEVDIYWDGGVQYAVTVGTVATNSMPFDAGIGDNLPTASPPTAVVVCKRVEVNADIDGDSLSFLACKQHYDQANETANSHVDFQSAAPAEIEELDLAANVPRTFNIRAGDPNGFTGDPITKLYVSNGSLVNTARFQLLALFDSTP